MEQKVIEDEIEEMEKSLDGEFVDEEPTAEPGVVEEPTNKDTPEPESEPAEPTEPKPPAEPEDPRDAEITRLKAELELAKKAKEEPTSEPPSEPEPEVKEPLTDEDFISDLDLDDLTRDPEALNQLLNKIYRKSYELTVNEIKGTVENLLKSIPDITRNTMAMEAQARELNKQFYEDNPDLKSWGKVVAAVFEDIQGSNPGKTYDELLPLVAEETRNRLGLRKDAIDNAKAKSKEGQPPPLPKNKKGERQNFKPDPSGFEKELEAMDTVLTKL